MSRSCCYWLTRFPLCSTSCIWVTEALCDWLTGSLIPLCWRFDPSSAQLILTTLGPAHLPEAPARLRDWLVDKLAGYPDCIGLTTASVFGGVRLTGHLTGGISPPKEWTQGICQIAGLSLRLAASGWLTESNCISATRFLCFFVFG